MDPATPLPTGTVTFLFTDIEGSTRLWEERPDAMRLALARHDACLNAAIESNHGHVFKTVGDAFCAAFATAPNALDAALAAQRHLAAACVRSGWRPPDPCCSPTPEIPLSRTVERGSGPLR